MNNNLKFAMHDQIVALASPPLSNTVSSVGSGHNKKVDGDV